MHADHGVTYGGYPPTTGHNTHCSVRGNVEVGIVQSTLIRITQSLLAMHKFNG